MLDRHDPFGRAMGLRQVMDRLLEDAFVMPRGGEAGTWNGPALNVYEENDQLFIEAQLPGMKPDDLDINVEQGVLTISGQTTTEEERKERNYLVREHRSGRFSRSMRLPATYNTENCTASFEHGVLQLTFPKSEAAKPRRIPIATGAESHANGSQPAVTSGSASS